MSERYQEFQSLLKGNAEAVEALLATLLSGSVAADEIARPERLLAAMRHGVLNGGKRLRPFLVIESAALFPGVERTAALRVGAALECIHCYSLVHDDLPAMDDDDLRRGQPTVHIAFDEAAAILAGDSLLTLAFDIVAAPETRLPDATKTALVVALARAAGIGGMAGGQALDLAAETDAPDEAGIVTLQKMKTGALLRFACEAGAIVAGASAGDRQTLRRYGETVGLAFQIADDLLDLTADAATMGKATGKDADRGKATLVARRGQAWAENRLRELVAEAEALLAPFSHRAGILIETAHFIANRRN
ncbi:MULTISPECIES: polyprenyl synthetase family protein [unclassified Shinella]|uniref:polyprenyl synthetase family protein n=1 Tax=unclassified Shinella TaxID=2643062 RepID=UPI00225C6F8E|nr:MULTISPECIES: farnesyl diphosphate synthase [unclassified Shinella]MCO5141315.1 polyprenyl synthetase family protein [Shinella sp.]MDC7257126.1 polyprenyl synthetase family protein [Shinella sp. YE25]CAI0339991.1 Farnesyl diphosphate synthase [Rhizobiaceae bacterium]CAK7258383.1 Geranylgeranyl pyrophosphate synthase [Shinella sp. WSC3-e]